MLAEVRSCHEKGNKDAGLAGNENIPCTSQGEYEVMKEAVKITRNGVILDLEITPGAKVTAIHGYNPWRKRIEIRISQRAQKGKANGELILFLSTLLNIRSTNIEIVSGLTSSKKSVMIFQGKPDEILEALTQK